MLGDREYDTDYVWICLLLSTAQDIVGKIYQSPAFQLADDVKKISSTELKRGDETKREKIG